MTAAATGHFAISTTGIADAFGFVETAGAAQGLAPETRRRLCVILDEVMGNLILHDPSVGPDHQVALTLTRLPRGVRLAICDPGAAFDPLVERPREAEAIGGLGLVITRGLARSLSYTRLADANRLDIDLADPA